MANARDSSRNEDLSAMRTAFIYEVRPDVYLGRAIWTSFLAIVVLCGMVIYHDGTMYPDLLVPVDAWRSHNPSGALYAEMWANVFANAVQVGFGFWGAALILLGVFRILTARKLIKTCFTLGIGFAILAGAASPLIALLFNWLIEKYPVIVQ